MDLKRLTLLLVIPGLAGLLWVSPGIGMLTLITGSVLLEFFLVRGQGARTTGDSSVSQKQSASEDDLSDLLEAFRRDTHV